jgi:MYXO-CTERM domain-containing protein
MRELEGMNVLRSFVAAAAVTISALVLPIATGAQQTNEQPGIGSPAQEEPRNTGRAETNDDVARRNQAAGMNEDDEGTWGWVGLLGLAGLLGLRRRDPYEARFDSQRSNT